MMISGIKVVSLVGMGIQPQYSNSNDNEDDNGHMIVLPAGTTGTLELSGKYGVIIVTDRDYLDPLTNELETVKVHISTPEAICMWTEITDRTVQQITSSS
jgi:hypothetical protein